MRKIGKWRWAILTLVVLGTITNYIDRNALAVLSPLLQNELHFTTAQYSYIVGAFQFCYSLMQPLAGYITDFLGLKLGYAIFAFLWGSVCLMHGFVGSWQAMAILRGALGLSESTALPSGVKTAATWFPASERAIATGWVTTGTSLGAMAAPPVAIWLATTWGWQWAFIVTGLIAVAFSILWLTLYHNPDKHPHISPAERDYILQNQEAAHGEARPSFKRVLQQRKFWAIAAARFLTEPAWATFSFWIPLYMVTVRHMDLKQFALFAWLPFLMADLGAAASGYVSNYIHRRFDITLINSRIAGFGMGAVLMIAPGLIGLFQSPIVAIFLFSLGGFAHQMLSSLLYALTADNFERRDVASAVGSAGMCAWMSAFGFSLIIGQLATTIGYEPLFVCLSVFDLTALAVVFVALRDKRRVIAPLAEAR